MQFLKKLFGTKEKNNEQTFPANETTPLNNRSLTSTEIRQDTMRICLNAGFKPADWLPTEFNRQLRPSIEIAGRLNAIKALVLWLMVPEEHLPSETITRFVNENGLADYMSESEKNTLLTARDDEQGRNFIGWKFENAWPLAWYFGYEEPEISGVMMTGEQMQDILMNYTCPLSERVKDWAMNRETIPADIIIKKEDLFYCLHNAVRSAQLGSNTVPDNFDPIGNGGVIHERRHALTWMLSKEVAWDDTDLST